jgi:hypothetical protein
MKTMTLQNKILERIRAEGVRPTPKSYFKARDLVLWILLISLAAALSLGFGMIIFMVKGADFGLFEKLGLSASQKVVYTVPFFWIATTLALAIAAFINFRNTRRGYKTTARQFAFIAALIAVACGSAVYALNITNYVDRAASRLPIYNAVTPLNTNTWLDPEQGLLSGIVREKESDEDFTLRDANAELWHITGDMSAPEGFKFQTGDRVKLIGEKTGDGEFEAIEIRPWENPPSPEDEE